MIRPAAVEDLPRLAECASSFYRASAFLRSFDLERFSRTWRPLIESGAGVIFIDEAAGQAPGFERPQAGIRGTIGGVVYPEPYSGERIATEFFWYVLPEARGGGLRLYRAFEQWAKEQAAAELRMVHLLDSMPDKVSRFYERQGFTPAEVHYVKRFSK